MDDEGGVLSENEENVSDSDLSETSSDSEEEIEIQTEGNLLKPKAVNPFEISQMSYKEISI